MRAISTGFQDPRIDWKFFSINYDLELWPSVWTPKKEAMQAAKAAKAAEKAKLQASWAAGAGNDKKDKKKKDDGAAPAAVVPFVNKTPKGQKKILDAEMWKWYDPEAVEAAWNDWWTEAG